MACRRCFVSGRVQGVFFRASTRDLALTLGLTGYARNMRDGRVEVLACGPGDAIDTLHEWLKVGPAAAQVSDVQCQAVDEAAPATFLTD